MSEALCANGLTDAFAGAMRLLATREHSQYELRRKLGQKGHEAEVIEQVLAQLIEQKLQSDARFVESFVNSYRERGKGPNRIRLELQQHRLPAELVDSYLDDRDVTWKEIALRVKLKKFGEEEAADFPQRMKQAKFLEYRGFTHEQISAAIGDDHD